MIITITTPCTSSSNVKNITDAVTLYYSQITLSKKVILQEVIVGNSGWEDCVGVGVRVRGGGGRKAGVMLRSVVLFQQYCPTPLHLYYISFRMAAMGHKLGGSHRY